MIELLKTDVPGWNEWRKKHPGRVNISGADLSLTVIVGANLSGVNLASAHLVSAYILSADLRGAKFSHAQMDSVTMIDDCKVDKATDFTGVGLDGARIEPRLKALLKYNIRQLGWLDWIKQAPWWRWPVWLFWIASDYGASLGRIAITFGGFSLLFACIYWACPGLVQGLEGAAEAPLGGFRLFGRAWYFSIIIMTTLGLGDIFANPESMLGHAILAFHVLMGYVLLGALITRLGILFTADGPAGKFAPTWKPEAKPAQQQADAGDELEQGDIEE